MSSNAVERSVDIDLAGLVDIYASGGEAELIDRIGDRLSLTHKDGNAPHYLLATNDGRRFAGDVEEWPNLNARLSETGTIDVKNDVKAHARATQLAPNLRLLVAQETGDTQALQRQIALVFLTGGAVLILAVGLLGQAAARRLATRIARVNKAFRGSDGELLSSFVSITERDEIDELTSHSAAAISRMERLVDAHRETSDQVAHEIRTPLMHIDSKLVKALNEKPAEDPARFIIGAREDMKRLIAMLESLLDIASSKARQGDNHGLKEVDLSGLLQRIGDLYSDSAEESGHIFEYRIAPDVTMQGEEVQLTRLVTNLLDNAFKYAPSGCTVTLSLEPGPVLQVADNGPGVDGVMRAQIFERFKRGATTSDAAYGAGLGLALARAIAERHGMALYLGEANDEVGKGACFIVSRESAA